MKILSECLQFNSRFYTSIYVRSIFVVLVQVWIRDLLDMKQAFQPFHSTFALPAWRKMLRDESERAFISYLSLRYFQKHYECRSELEFCLCFGSTFWIDYNISYDLRFAQQCSFLKDKTSQISYLSSAPAGAKVDSELKWKLVTKGVLKE